MADNNGNAADGKSSGLVGKVIGIVFGAVIAPILVALAIKYLGPRDKPPEAPAKQDAPISPQEVVVKLLHQPTTPVPVPETKKPLTAGNLITPSLGDNFYSYSNKRGSTVYIRSDPPDAECFRYIEAPPGPKPLPSILAPTHLGAALLSTKEEFEDYDLVVWFRWGDKGSRGKRTRPAAILLHCTPGTEGQLGRNVLPQCVAVLLHEGQVGSLRVLGLEGAIQCKAKVADLPSKDQYVYEPSAPVKTLTSTNASWWGGQRQSPKSNPGDWDGRILCRGYKAEEAEAVHEKDLGPWIQLRIECSHGNVKVRVGTEVTSEITDCNLTRGRIGLASLQSEWYIGRLEVIPRRK